MDNACGKCFHIEEVGIVFGKWLFLTLGMLIAVFGMRLLFPLIIVSQTSDLSIENVWKIAIYAPYEYSRILTLHHGEISAFGGVLSYLIWVFS